MFEQGRLFGNYVTSLMEWSGSVHFDMGGVSAVRLDASMPAQLLIDDTLVVSTELPGADNEYHFAEPLHQASVVVRAIRSASEDPANWRVRLVWQRSWGEWTAFADYEPPRAQPEERGAADDANPLPDSAERSS